MVAAQLERTEGDVSAPDSIEDRVIAAMLACIARWGVAKTTADDIAREAGISRATLYRAFPGGRDTLFDALLRHEAARFFGTIDARVRSAAGVEDLIVEGVLAAAELLRRHDAAQYVLVHEPELVLPVFAFHRLAPALDVAVAFAAPHLQRFLSDPSAAQRGAEWIVRVLLSYVISPSPLLDLVDPESVGAFVRTYVLPVVNPVP